MITRHCLSGKMENVFVVEGEGFDARVAWLRGRGDDRMGGCLGKTFGVRKWKKGEETGLKFGVEIWGIDKRLIRNQRRIKAVF